MCDFSNKAYESGEFYKIQPTPIQYSSFFRRWFVRPLATWFSDGSW